MLKRADHLDRIIAALGSLAYYLKLNSAQGFISPAAHLEDFCIPLLGAVYGYDLTNANAAKSNTPAIDLIDEHARLGIQVTINDPSSKISHTYERAANPKHKLGEKIERLIVFFVTTKAPTPPGNLPQVAGIEIESLDLTQLITKIRSMEEKHEEIAALLDRELSGGSPAQYVTTITQITSIIAKNYQDNRQSVIHTQNNTFS